jgi:RNA polymerase sigma-70 factor (ECF subfamily)
MSILVKSGLAQTNPTGMAWWWSRKRWRTSAAPAARAAEGERPSWETLYRERFDYVWHVLRRMGVPLRDREDVAHDVFMAAERALPTFDPTLPILPWLHGIAFNVASKHRGRGCNKNEVLMDEDNPQPIDGAPGPEHLNTEAQDRALMLKLIQTIDLDRRVVLSMHDIDEMKMEDIARALGITEATAYKRLYAARRDLDAAAARFFARERHGKGSLAVVPLDLSALLAVDRRIPEAPAGARERVWSRLQASKAQVGANGTGGARSSIAPRSGPAKIVAYMLPRVAPLAVGVLNQGARSSNKIRHPCGPSSPPARGAQRLPVQESPEARPDESARPGW